MMCYNNGVTSYHKQNFEEAVEWLKESFDLGKIGNSFSKKLQVVYSCRLYRLNIDMLK